VDIRWFGASPNATSSQNSASIQKAIDSLPGSGGTVLFPAGVYRVADAIRVVRNNVSLIGEGIDATTLVADVALYAAVRFGDLATIARRLCRSGRHQAECLWMTALVSRNSLKAISPHSRPFPDIL
jgi:pectin methylesterase-like acyl-CoA thioesterase